MGSIAKNKEKKRDDKGKKPSTRRNDKNHPIQKVQREIQPGEKWL
jgi:hypothetical protein